MAAHRSAERGRRRNSAHAVSIVGVAALVVASCSGGDSAAPGEPPLDTAVVSTIATQTSTTPDSTVEPVDTVASAVPASEIDGDAEPVTSPPASPVRFVAVSDVSIAYDVEAAAQELPVEWPKAGGGESVAPQSTVTGLVTVVQRLHDQLYGWAGPATVEAGSADDEVEAVLTIIAIAPIVIGVVDGAAQPGVQLTLADGLTYVVSATPAST